MRKSEMRCQGKARVSHGLLSRGVGVYEGPCRFGQVGHGGKPWLVGCAVERVSVGQLDGLLGQEQRGEGCNIFFG
jgi:hypothetical protein